MPFLIGEVGGISKHVPTVQKEGRARSGEQQLFGVPHLNFFISRFTAIRFIVSIFLARTTFAILPFSWLLGCL